MTPLDIDKPNLPEAIGFAFSLPTAMAHLCAIHPRKKNGKTDIVGQSFPKTDAGRAAALKWLTVRTRQGYGIYFNCNDVVPLGPNHKKASEGEVTAVHYLHVDVDPPDGGVLTPEQLADARIVMLARIESTSPSMIINSGNGYGVFYAIDPVALPLLPSAAELAKLTLEQQATLLAEHLAVKERNIGLSIRIGGDNCENLDRVMRLPFTVNIPNAKKIKAGRVPVLADIVDDSRDFVTYTLDEFPRIAKPEKKSKAKAKGKASGSFYQQIGSPVIPDSVDLSKLDEDTRAKIIDGAPKGADRSKVVYGLACELRRQGWDDGSIIFALTNPLYAISAHMLEQTQRPPLEQASKLILDINAREMPTAAVMEDFIAVLCEDNKYLYIPTRGLWSGSTIAKILGKAAPTVLTNTRHAAIIAWCPGLELWVKDRLLVEGGWIDKTGANTINTYIEPPTMAAGDKDGAGRWIDLMRLLFPNDADHLIKMLAHKVQYPGVKINHGIIMGSDEQGIGKDTLLEAIVRILGRWNVSDVTAVQAMDEKFNPHLESLLCRISEADDLGDDSKYAFYNRRKTWMVDPPSVLSVADKHVKAHPVVNVTLVITSSNHKGGLYIDRKDRRDYVAWSDVRQADFAPEFFTEFYAWYDNGGVENVNAYLRSLDLSTGEWAFDPKSPPPKTPAWQEIVNADTSTSTTELDDLINYMECELDLDDDVRDLLDYSGEERPAVFTIKGLITAASHPDVDGRFDDALAMLEDNRQAKALSHKLARSGYTPVTNDTAKDGLWRVAGRRTVIYARSDLSMSERTEAAEKLVVKMFASAAEQSKKQRAKAKATGAWSATGTA